MQKLIVAAAALTMFSAPAQAQSIYGKWRTENTDPGICLVISATEFIDPISETHCRVKQSEKTGRNTRTLSLTCSLGGDGEGDEAYSLTVYTRLLSPNRLRMRQGSDGALLVYRRC